MSTLVSILTFCRKPELLYGSLLTFKTLRVGFPESRVVVIDNGSIPEARDAIRCEAEKCGAEFIQYDEPIEHADYLRQAIEGAGDGPLAIVDPDCALWAPIVFPEGDYLVAGRLLPTFADKFTNTITLARLHTSLWLVPRASRLLAAARDLEARFRGVGDGARELDAFRPIMFPVGGIVHRLDTGAATYQAYPRQCRAFTPDELDRYDHLIAGSHVDLVAPVIEAGQHLAESHAMARRDLSSLRGAWRRQEAVFQALAAKVGVL